MRFVYNTWMQPIRFECHAQIRATPAEIAAAIADLSRWPEFTGYGPLPGIAKAEYERRTEPMTGSRIRVTNKDGSSHVEEILAWDHDGGIRMKLHEFTPPLSRLASHFVEEWRFRPENGATGVVRRFELHPRGSASRPLLRLISLLFRRAIDRHMAQLARNPTNLPWRPDEQA